MINYCTKSWLPGSLKKSRVIFLWNSGGTGLDTSGTITQFGTTSESSSGLEVRETSRRRGVKLPSSYLSRIFDSITMHREAASPQGGLLWPDFLESTKYILLSTPFYLPHSQKTYLLYNSDPIVAYYLWSIEKIYFL